MRDVLLHFLLIGLKNMNSVSECLEDMWLVQTGPIFYFYGYEEKDSVSSCAHVLLFNKSE